MKVLFVLSNFTFPTNEGAHHQTFCLIKSLAARGVNCSVFVCEKAIGQFNVDLFSENLENVSVEGVLDVRGSYSLVMAKRLFSRILNFNFSRDSILFRKINALSANYDVVHFEGVPLVPLFVGRIKKPAVFSVIDAWSLRQFRLALSSSLSRFVPHVIFSVISLAVERFFLSKASVIHVVSPSDADYLRKICGKTVVADIPVMADVASPSSYSPIQELGVNVLIWGDIRVPFIYNGVLGFLRKVAPDFCGQDIKIRVLGRSKPDANLLSAAEYSKADVEFLDWVDDIEAVVASSSLVLLVDQGGTGLKNRLLQAMVWGRPVVASKSSSEGISISDGKEALIFSSWNECANKIKYLLSLPDSGAELSSNGMNFVRENYSSDSVSGAWFNLYSNLYMNK